MSKTNKNKELWTFNIVITMIAFLLFPPVILISLFIVFILYNLNIKGKYAIFTGIALFILTVIIENPWFDSFVINISENIRLIINSIIKGNALELLQISFKYNSASWIFIFYISTIIAGYFLIRIEHNQRLEKVGVRSLDKEIDIIEEKEISQTNISKTNHEKKKTFIGINKSKKPVYCSDNAKHIFVCGTTGSGKTVLLSNFIKSGIDKDYGMLIIDGKGDVGKDSILEITKDMCVKKDRTLYIIDMNNPDTSTKYNPFKNASATICKDMLVNMSDWSEEHYKSNAERYIQRLINLLILNGTPLSFLEIVRNLPVSKFQELSNKLTKEKVITKEDNISNIEITSSSGKIAESASARFSTIAESEIGTIFQGDGIDIYEAIKSKAVILFVLNPLIYPETSQALGRLVLIDSKKAISNFFKEDTSRKFFIFDEINVYASTVLTDLINKSRSAGVTCIPATQSLADLESAAGESFKQQIIENCNNYIVLRQNSSTSAEEWAKTLGTKEAMKMTYQMSSTDSTGKGTARKVREFIVHPDDIKAQMTGSAIFLSRDNGKCERITINKPF